MADRRSLDADCLCGLDADSHDPSEALVVGQLSFLYRSWCDRVGSAFVLLRIHVVNWLLKALRIRFERTENGRKWVIFGITLKF